MSSEAFFLCCHFSHGTMTRIINPTYTIERTENMKHELDTTRTRSVGELLSNLLVRFSVLCSPFASRLLVFIFLQLLFHIHSPEMEAWNDRLGSLKWATHLCCVCMCDFFFVCLFEVNVSVAVSYSAVSVLSLFSQIQTEQRQRVLFFYFKDRKSLKFENSFF